MVPVKLALLGSDTHMDPYHLSERYVCFLVDAAFPCGQNCAGNTPVMSRAKDKRVGTLDTFTSLSFT